MAMAKRTSSWLQSRRSRVLLGHGDGTFEVEPQTLSVPSFGGSTTNYTPAVSAGDFDKDGHADFAVIGTHSYRGDDDDPGPTAIFVYYGKGDGNVACNR